MRSPLRILALTERARQTKAEESTELASSAGAGHPRTAIRALLLVIGLGAAGCTLGSQPDIPSVSEEGDIGSPSLEPGGGTGGATAGPEPCTPEPVGGAGGEGGALPERRDAEAEEGTPPCVAPSP